MSLLTMAPENCLAHKGMCTQPILHEKMFSHKQYQPKTCMTLHHISVC